jgi:hypothetical protein
MSSDYAAPYRICISAMMEADVKQVLVTIAHPSIRKSIGIREPCLDGNESPTRAKALSYSSSEAVD